MQGPHQGDAGNRGDRHPAAIDMSIGIPAAESEEFVAHKILSGKFYSLSMRYFPPEGSVWRGMGKK
ncbi:hypothetical protein NUKP43_03980 [Klebsiella quasipneumoniae]|nr:hypothetical protein NUKP43_03980 [Klebsiella quasipneumoniae]